MKTRVSSPEDLYDRTAERWVRDEPSSVSDFTGRPATLALCQPIAGHRVLDLGCGEGYCARQLKRAGAAEVVAVDLSARMIDAALDEERQRPLGIRYRQGDATELDSLGSGAFDRVVAMFLFNYLDRAQTDRCMAEVARVLVPGGRFVFAVPHPSFPFLRSSGSPFYFDVGEAGYFGARDGRFPGRIWRRDGGVLDVQICHKTVADYFDAMRRAGFRDLPSVRELGVTPEIRALDPEFFAPLGDLPLHLAVAVDR